MAHPENLGDRTEHEEIERLVNIFSNYYERADVTDLDDDFMYEMITHVDLKDEDLRALIAVDFRVSSSSMIFSSDVCLQAGYIVPPMPTLSQQAHRSCRMPKKPSTSALKST